MGNLRKFKRVKKSESLGNDQSFTLTAKGKLIGDAVVVKYLELLVQGQTLEAEQFLDSLREQLDVIGIVAIEKTHRDFATVLGIDYAALSKEQQHRFLIDNPDYIDKVQSQQETSKGNNQQAKIIEDKAKKVYSQKGQQILQDYHRNILPNIRKVSKG